MNQVNSVKQYLSTLQNQLCQAFQAIDKKVTIKEDCWQHEYRGGGQTRILCEGTVFEKAGINISHVSGRQLPPTATQARPHLADSQFEALGISLVVHPENPYIPTTHANLRFFIATLPTGSTVWWFGGGYDLTPYYGFDEDCRHWHQIAQKACAPFGNDVYLRYKRWCDEYFYLKHRQEPRGIGGLFFDDLNEWDFETCFTFLQSIGNSYLDAYLPIVEKRRHYHYGEREKKFQQMRRGRYVEFNLLYDRGTLFGLQSGGRVESILMSLPPIVHWDYNWQPEQGSEEARLYTDYLIPRDWIHNDSMV